MASLWAEYSIIDLDLRAFEVEKLFAEFGTEKKISNSIFVLQGETAGIRTNDACSGLCTGIAVIILNKEFPQYKY